MLNKKTSAIFVSALFALILFSAHQASASVSDWQKGISMQPVSTEDFSSGSFKQSLTNAAADHVNYVTLIIPWYQSNIYSTDIQRGGDTPSDSSLISAIQLAHSLGMKVMLKPHLNSYDGQWRASINPSDRAGWFTNYDNMVLHYAQLAQQSGVEQLCVGTELISMSAAYINSTNTQNWQNLISQIRGIYGGKLTYSANWGAGNFFDEADEIIFWPSLDYIGISAYYNLNASNNVNDIESAWDGWNKSNIGPLHYRYNKPILFTEIGYRSVSGGHNQPWNYNLGGGYDASEQSNAYQALFSYWNNYGYIAGVDLWNWETNPNAGGEGNTNYTPQNKPAQSIIAQWYGMGNSGGDAGGGSGGSISGTNGVGGSTANSGGQSGAYSATSAISGNLAAGQNILLAVSLKNNGQNASGLIVDNEIYNSSGQQVFQKFYENQNIAAGQTNNYNFAWNAQNPGAYVLKVGVFNSNWSALYSWQDQVSNINIQNFSGNSGGSGSEGVSSGSGGSTNPGSGSDLINIWWPTNGAAVSGTQPFKAIFNGLPVEQYNMFWQVDNGQWIYMPNNYDGYPHKQADVDLSGWVWKGSGPYDLNFIAQTNSGTFSKDLSIYTTH